RDLLDRDERDERPRSQPAVRLVEEETEDVVLPVELDDVPREFVGRVDLGRPRRDPLARNRADEVAQLSLLAAQLVPGHAVILVAANHAYPFRGNARFRIGRRAPPWAKPEKGVGAMKSLLAFLAVVAAAVVVAAPAGASSGVTITIRHQKVG